MESSSVRGGTPKTFMITGASSGFGRALVDAALAAGHRVVATVRSPSAAEQLERLKRGSCFCRLLDVTDDGQVDSVVGEVEKTVGPIDVLVNSAGYGHEGALEESSMDDLRQQFAVNVFGAVAMMKAVLPHMRARRRGHILNITSMGGHMTMPGLSYYHGSKFALEGISESLGKEVRPFGIRVTAVAPGSFRTDWAGRSMVRSPRSIADYDPIMDPLRAARAAKSGRQAGDPAKAAAAMLQIVETADPPAHLLLGADGLQLVKERIGDLKAEIAAWEPLSASTNFD
jgi:NAD(P)-dependent dehydrogenase (short-subunit alcohol dehydrogenase family)